MNDDLAKFKTLYNQTALEHIRTLKSGLEKFVASEEKEVANEIFIAAHSLKGQSLMMGYQKVGKAALALEKTFRGVKDGIIKKEQVNINSANQVVDKIGRWLDAADAANLEPDLDTEVSELEKLLT